MKTSTTISESKAYPLAQTQLQNKFNLNGQDIIPVETSSYHTIDFRDPNNANSIMYSTSLFACAIVLIKNFNEETGKYDNIVTMGHFHPANAYRDSKAIENLEKIMQDFEERGGVFSSKTSVILAGGGLLPEENIKDTTPLGPLLDVVKLLKDEKGFKFTHHEKSINDLRGSINKNHPETQGSSVFVNQDGTSIIGFTRIKSSDESSVRLLTKEIGSMPFKLLSDIGASENSFYPAEIKTFMETRLRQIIKLMDGEAKPDLSITKTEELMSKIKVKLTSTNEGRLK